MAEHTFYSSVRYRSNFNVLSMEYLLHRGINSTAGLTGYNLVISNNNSGKVIVDLPLKKVDSIIIGKGNIRIQYEGQIHVLDFYSPFRKNLLTKTFSPKRAHELAEKFTDIGLKVQFKVL